MSSGKIVQIIGAVIDVEFPRESVPQVYDALNVEGKPIVLEVQQQLGDNVRTIAMGSTEGLSRGLDVTNTNAAISVPVGTETLGRIMEYWGTQSMKKAILARKLGCQYTERHQPSQNSQRLRNYLRQVSR